MKNRKDKKAKKKRTTTNIEDSLGHLKEDSLEVHETHNYMFRKRDKAPINPYAADDLRDSLERGELTPRRSKVGKLETQDELEQRKEQEAADMQEAASLVVNELLDAAVDEEDITEAMVKYLLANKLRD